MTLTFAQQRLIGTLVHEKPVRAIVSSDQRNCIRELCLDLGYQREPEQLLIAFKKALEHAANDARIPFGPDRSAMLARLVSVFIDELYSFNASGTRASATGVTNATIVNAPAHPEI